MPSTTHPRPHVARTLMRWCVCLMLLVSSFAYGLTSQQQAYLNQLGKIRYCVDPGWAPVEWITQGQAKGIASDYLTLFSQALGISFELQVTESWQQSAKMLFDGACDLTPLIVANDTRLGKLLFTRPYFNGVNVVISRDNLEYISDLAQLEGRKVAVPRHYATTAHVRNHYPQLTLVERNTISEALTDVATGRADAAISNLLVANNQIRELGLGNLKVAGQVPYVSELAVGIHPSKAPLLPIMQEVLDNISMQQRVAILNKWQRLKFEHEYQIKPFVYVFLVFLFGLLLVLFHHSTVRKMNIKLLAANKQLSHKHQELLRISQQDAMTGIPNRLRLNQLLEIEITRTERYDTQFSLLLLDIDHFKRINDNFGHPMGDQVLIEFAKLVNSHLRQSDLFGRWGGEEFLLVCPETTLEEARQVAGKINLLVSGHHFPHGERLTCSIGVGQYINREGQDSFMQRIDAALYEAKHQGRNRYVTAAPSAQITDFPQRDNGKL